MIRRYRRKVQLVGGTTLTVSLPKEWARAVKLEPGSEVIIEVLPDGALRLKPSETASHTPLQAMVCCNEEDLGTVVREVIAYYLAGYKSIKVVFEAGSQKFVSKVIDHVRNSVIGLEVLDQEERSVTFHNVADSEFMSLWAALGKLFRAVISALEDLGKCFKEYNRGLLESIISRDYLVDKLYLLVLKQLAHSLYGLKTGEISTPVEAVHLALAAKCAERVADHATNMARVLLERGTVFRVPGDVEEAYSLAVELFRRSTAALLKLDHSEAVRVTRKADTLKRMTLPSEEQVGVTGFVGSIAESVRRIAAYSMDIAEATLNVVALRQAVSEACGAAQGGGSARQIP